MSLIAPGKKTSEYVVALLTQVGTFLLSLAGLILLCFLQNQSPTSVLSVVGGLIVSVISLQTGNKAYGGWRTGLKTKELEAQLSAGLTNIEAAAEAAPTIEATPVVPAA